VIPVGNQMALIMGNNFMYNMDEDNDNDNNNINIEVKKDEEPKITVIVKNEINKSTLLFTMNKNNSILDLKGKIKERLSINTMDQILTLNGKQLDDTDNTNTLQKNGFMDGDTINLNVNIVPITMDDDDEKKLAEGMIIDIDEVKNLAVNGVKNNNNNKNKNNKNNKNVDIMEDDEEELILPKKKKANLNSFGFGNALQIERENVINSQIDDDNDDDLDLDGLNEYIPTPKTIKNENEPMRKRRKLNNDNNDNNNSGNDVIDSLLGFGDDYDDDEDGDKMKVENESEDYTETQNTENNGRKRRQKRSVKPKGGGWGSLLSKRSNR